MGAESLQISSVEPVAGTALGMAAGARMALAGGLPVSVPGVFRGFDRISGESVQRAGVQPVAEGGGECAQCIGWA